MKVDINKKTAVAFKFPRLQAGRLWRVGNIAQESWRNARRHKTLIKSGIDQVGSSSWSLQQQSIRH